MSSKNYNRHTELRALNCPFLSYSRYYNFVWRARVIDLPSGRWPGRTSEAQRKTGCARTYSLGSIATESCRRVWLASQPFKMQKVGFYKV